MEQRAVILLCLVVLLTISTNIKGIRVQRVAHNEVEVRDNERAVENTAVDYSPRWPTKCNFTSYIGRYLFSYYYNTTTTFTQESSCRHSCEVDDRCGIYEWSIRFNWGVTTLSCSKYSISTKMWAEEAKIPWQWLLSSGVHANVSSKDCGAIINRVGRNTYPVVRDRLSPISNYGLADLNVPVANALTVAQCFLLCNLYTACKSAHYWTRSSASYAGCYLFTITITELIEEGRTGDIFNNTDTKTWPIYKTYERYVDGKPYRPGDVGASTETPEPDTDCPEDLNLLDGYSMCLAPGQVTQEQCERLEGCCFYEVAAVPLCVRPPDGKV